MGRQPSKPVPSRRSHRGWCLITKVVINRKFGGFGLSEKALDKLVEEHGFTVTGIDENGSYEDPDADIHDYMYEFGGPEDDEFQKRHYGLNNERDPDIRSNSALVQVVEELGSEDASGDHAELKIVEIPDDVEWTIEEYDGAEWVAEKHRTWR